MTYSEFWQVLEGTEYLNFVQEAKDEKGSHVHHIYPRSFESGRIDKKENLVKLSEYDHVKAHVLLVEALEKVGRTKGQSYIKASHAATCLLGKYNISDTDLENKLQKAREVAQTNTIRTLKERYGSCTGAMQAADVKKRRWKTLQSKYGSGGPLRTDAAIEKSVRSKIQKYGSVENALHCTAAEERRKNTNLLRYGATRAFNSVEVKQKQLEERRIRYGGDAAGMTRTPEACRKRNETKTLKYGNPMGACHTEEALQKSIEGRKNTWKKIRVAIEKPEFLSWFESRKTEFRNRPIGLKAFLVEKGIKLENYVGIDQSR